MASKGPNLKGYLDKTISLQLNKGRRVTGTLRGFDQFMNIVLGDAFDQTPQKGASSAAAPPSTPIGMVVVRGNSIVQLELTK